MPRHDSMSLRFWSKPPRNSTRNACESFANDSSTLLFEHLSIFITFSIWISWFEDLIFSCSGFPCFVFWQAETVKSDAEPQSVLSRRRKENKEVWLSDKLDMKYIENMFSKMFFDFWESCIYKHNRVAIVKLDTWNGMKCDQGGRLQFAPHSVLAIHLQKLLIWDL